MDMNTISQVAHLLGLDNAVPVLLAVLTLARAVDALIRQPAPGSHWIPLRKMVSLLSFGVANAKPAGQPSIVTWLRRLVIYLAQAVPPPAAAGRVEPVLAPVPQPSSPATPAAAPVPGGIPVSTVGQGGGSAKSLLELARSTLGAPASDSVTFRKP